MQKKDITKILKLNNKFYQIVAKDFSDSRKLPWEGWGRVIEIIKSRFKQVISVDSGNKEKHKNKTKILDIGCGNGRFFKYLTKNIDNFEYTGIDMNNDLLKEAKEISTSSDNRSKKLIKQNIFQDLHKINDKFDIVVSFGITHHVPDNDFRNDWFKILPNLLLNNKNSLLVLTFWEFEEEPGEYIIGWKDKKDTARYCYRYSDNEIKNIISNYKKVNLELVDRFKSDKNNLYLIFGKI